MKVSLFALVASSALALSSAAFASSSIECSNSDGFQVALSLTEGSALGTLTYGTADELTTVANVESAFSNGLGAAVKGSEVLFVVSGAQGAKLGELVVAGETTRVSCK